MERYDIAIIGTGPAGLSAAITAKIRNKKILLIGNPNFSDKVQKAHQIQNYLGLPAISGKDLAKAFENHINSMDITITEGKVNAVYPMGSYFGLQVSQDIYEAFLKAAYIEELAQLYYNAVTVLQGKEPKSFAQEELQKWEYPKEIKFPKQ